MSQLAALTPYAAAKIVNIALAANEIDKTITPQMMYTYAKKQYIKTVKVENDNKVYFDGEAFKLFLQKYIANLKNNVSNRHDYDELAKQYM